MNDTFEVGDTIVEMPGSTHRRTWEVVSIDGETVALKLVDKAVGYITEEQIERFDLDTLSESVDNGVLTGQMVKTLPDLEIELVP